MEKVREFESLRKNSGSYSVSSQSGLIQKTSSFDCSYQERLKLIDIDNQLRAELGKIQLAAASTLRPEMKDEEAQTGDDLFPSMFTCRQYSHKSTTQAWQYQKESAGLPAKNT